MPSSQGEFTVQLETRTFWQQSISIPSRSVSILRLSMVRLSTPVSSSAKWPPLSIEKSRNVTLRQFLSAMALLPTPACSATYLAKAVPNPIGKRAPWYANTAPTYAGIFLWIAFYQQMAGGTLQHGGLALCLVALAVAGILSYALYYRVPAMLGMKTGFPLYVVGSSTFGTAGGYVMPGLLMGLLQIGWFAVATFFSADYILRGMGMASKPGTLPFGIACVLWGGAMAFAGAKGVQYVSKIALFLNAIPLLMLLVVFFQTSGGIGRYQVAAAQENSFGAFTTMIAIVIGFFATAGAAGADFGMNARDERDVRWGGLVGITLAVIVAGGLPLLAVAGAHGSGRGGRGFRHERAQ